MSSSGSETSLTFVALLHGPSSAVIVPRQEDGSDMTIMAVDTANAERHRRLVHRLDRLDRYVIKQRKRGPTLLGKLHPSSLRHAEKQHKSR
mmetsp:Transcript_29554/g.46340  ORF Transcript_29554/g.46340 Transcript_29554/m.46340 type:complete len:91 (+) Transcript_29554:87-359(+)